VRGRGLRGLVYLHDAIALYIRERLNDAARPANLHLADYGVLPQAEVDALVVR
jgi:hypothetical protein